MAGIDRLSYVSTSTSWVSKILGWKYFTQVLYAFATHVNFELLSYYFRALVKPLHHTVPPFLTSMTQRMV